MLVGSFQSHLEASKCLNKSQKLAALATGAILFKFIVAYCTALENFQAFLYSHCYSLLFSRIIMTDISQLNFYDFLVKSVCSVAD